MKYSSSGQYELNEQIVKLYKEITPKICEQGAQVGETTSGVQRIIASYHIILIARFLLAIRGQPRLALVMTTMSKASMTLSHLCIVVVVMFLGFATSGHLLFGHHVPAFSTWENSVATCFSIAMEGQYPWKKLTAHELYTTTVWTWSFVLFMTLILVNTFLAVLFEAYMDVRSGVCPDTIWQTCLGMARQARAMCVVQPYQGEIRVPALQLVHTIHAQQSQLLTPWMLKDATNEHFHAEIDHIFGLARSIVDTDMEKAAQKDLSAMLASCLLSSRKTTSAIKSCQCSTQEASTTCHEDERSTLVRQFPEKVPTWVHIELKPHLEKQVHLLKQLHRQVVNLGEALQQRGLGKDSTTVLGCSAKQSASTAETVRHVSGHDHVNGSGEDESNDVDISSGDVEDFSDFKDSVGTNDNIDNEVVAANDNHINVSKHDNHDVGDGKGNHWCVAGTDFSNYPDLQLAATRHHPVWASSPCGHTKVQKHHADSGEKHAEEQRVADCFDGYIDTEHVMPALRCHQRWTASPNIL